MTADKVEIGGLTHLVSHVNNVEWLRSNVGPDVKIKIIQTNWNTHAYSKEPQIEFTTWTGTGGENGDCDYQSIAVFRLRDWKYPRKERERFDLKLYNAITA